MDLKLDSKSIIIISVIVLCSIITIVTLILTKPGGDVVGYDIIKKLANELRQKGLHKQAIEEYKNILYKKRTPKKIKANINYIIGDIYMQELHDYENALAHYLKSKHINPKSGLINNINQNIVSCLESLGRTREAQLTMEDTTVINKDKKKGGTVIARIGERAITREEFDRWMDSIPDEIKKKHSEYKDKKALLQNFVINEMMYHKARRKGYDNDVEILRKSFDFKKGILVQKIYEEEILKDAKITPTEMQLYYDAHKDDYKDKKTGKQKSFYEVREDIYQKLMQLKIDEKSAQLMGKMMQAERVRIYDDLLE